MKFNWKAMLLLSLIFSGWIALSMAFVEPSLGITGKMEGLAFRVSVNVLIGIVSSLLGLNAFTPE